MMTDRREEEEIAAEDLGETGLAATILSHGPDGVMVVDPDRQAIRAVNPVLSDLFGYEPDELLDLSPADLLPNAMNRFDEFSTTVLDSGYGRLGPITCLTKDGRAIDVELTATAKGFGDREHLIVTVRGPSGLEDTQANDDRHVGLRTIVENVPIVLFTLNTDGIFTRSEGLGLDRLGLDPGVIVGESVFEVYQDHPQIPENIHRALAGEEVHETVEVDGTAFETWYQPLRNEEGNVVQVVGVAVDVTERKRHAERLEQLNEASRELMRATSKTDVADTAVDIARDILNYPFVVLWSRSPDGEDLVPLAATESAPDLVGGTAESEDELGPIVAGTAEMVAFQAGETRVVPNYGELDRPGTPDSSLGTVLLVPLGDNGLLAVGSPEVTEVDSSTRDLLEILARNASVALDLVARERALREREEALTRQNERLETFASVVSHDLRSPLNIITGRLELARETGDPEHFRTIDDAVDRIDGIIDDVLRLAREGRVTGELEPVSFEDAARSAWSTVHPEDARLEITDNATLLADEDRLIRLFENLFRNAAEHGDKPVRVRAGATAEGFFVEDDGVGIPPEDREAIFNMGYSTAEGGTGFGLAIVEGIAEAHGWEVSVEDSPSGGARFLVTGVDRA